MWMRTQKRDRCKVILHTNWRPLLKRWRLPRGDKLNESKKASQCPNLMNSATLNWRKYHQLNPRDSSALRTNFAQVSQRKLTHKLHVWMDLRCSESLSLTHRTKLKACTLKIQSLLFLTSERRVQTEVTFSLKSKGMYNILRNFGRRWATKKTKRQLTTAPKSDDQIRLFDLNNGLLCGKLFIKLPPELLFWVKSRELLLYLELCRRFVRLMIYSSYYCYFNCAHF